MPSSDSHKGQARHNKNFYDELNKNINIKNTFFDWITTVIFYIALHQNDCFLCSQNIHPIDHKDRRKIIAEESKKHSGLFSKKYWYSYQRLYNESLKARYKPDEWKRDINSSRIKLLLKDLDVIKNRRK